MLALAHQTPRGLWTVEARLLYDLQKVCVDQSQTISTVDVMHWILSLGQRPIRRELPNQRLVLVTRHLRTPSGVCRPCGFLGTAAVAARGGAGEATLDRRRSARESFRPKIAAALDSRPAAAESR